MKWVNHKILTASMVYALFHNPIYSISAAIGSIFPDVVEGRVNILDPWSYKKWKKRHRGFSHWIILYLIVLVSLILIGQFVEFSPHWSLLRDLLCFFLVGCILHIIEDAFCGRVPLINPYKREGFMMFRMGSLWEYLFVVTLTILMLIPTIQEVIK